MYNTYVHNATLSHQNFLVWHSILTPNPKRGHFALFSVSILLLCLSAFAHRSPSFCCQTQYFVVVYIFWPLPWDFYSITQWSCSAPGSLWDLPVLNPESLPQKSGTLPMSNLISANEQPLLQWAQKTSPMSHHISCEPSHLQLNITIHLSLLVMQTV